MSRDAISNAHLSMEKHRRRIGARLSCADDCADARWRTAPICADNKINDLRNLRRCAPICADVSARASTPFRGVCFAPMPSRSSFAALQNEVERDVARFWPMNLKRRSGYSVAEHDPADFWLNTVQALRKGFRARGNHNGGGHA